MTREEFQDQFHSIQENDFKKTFVLIDELVEYVKPDSLNSFIRGNTRILIDTDDQLRGANLSEKIDSVIIALGDLFVMQNDNSIEIRHAIQSVLYDEYGQDEFWEVTVNIANQSVTPYFETKFLFSYDLPEREKIYAYVMSKAVLLIESEEVLNSGMNIQGFDIIKLNIIVKLLNTLVDATIGKGRAFSSWLEYSKNVLYLKDDDARFIWKLIETNRQDLYFRLVMRKIQDIEANMLSMKDDIGELRSSKSQ
jgi:hypothetical protein